MALARILGRGQLTLPTGVRRAAGIKPGDSVSVEVIAPGRLEMIVLPTFSPWELRDRYPIESAVREASDRAAWQAQAALDVLGS